MKIFSSYTKGFIAIAAALSISSSIACLCVYMGTFEEFSKLHPVIVRGTVYEHGQALRDRPGFFKTMTVTVSDTIKGSFPHTEVEFFGDTGMSCLRYITLEDYPLGSEHLFILESDKSAQPLIVCGESSVLITDSTVQGHMRDANGYLTYERDLEEFLDKVK